MCRHDASYDFVFKFYFERFLFRYFAQRTLRIERMYAFWGQDIDKKTTPFDLNREFRVSFDVRRNERIIVCC
jgi:hypothetical protein